jgi:hypothetical protein
MDFWHSLPNLNLKKGQKGKRRGFLELTQTNKPAKNPRKAEVSPHLWRGGQLHPGQKSARSSGKRTVLSHSLVSS